MLDPLTPRKNVHYKALIGTRSVFNIKMQGKDDGLTETRLLTTNCISINLFLQLLNIYGHILEQKLTPGVVRILNYENSQYTACLYNLYKFYEPTTTKIPSR